MTKHKILFILSALAVLALSSQFVQTAMACEADDSGTSRCVQGPHFRVRAPTVARPAAAIAARTAPTPLPVVRRGGSPGDAMDIAEVQQTLDGGGAAWYKIGAGGGPQHLEVWLDAHGRPGLGFAVFSPEQMNDLWPSTPPKGRGSHNRTEPSHDLYWSGQAPAGGTWYVLVTNYDSSPVPYVMGSNRVETGRKQCESYWEYIGTNLVYWTACK